MGSFTYDELEKALGSTFRLLPCGDKGQARVLTANGFDIAFIDIDGGCIEATLCAKWHAAKETASEGFPGPQDIAAARQQLAEEIQPQWERAGFAVDEEGSVNSFCYTNEPEIQIPLFEVDVSKDVPTLAAAVETIRWICNADTETWL